MPGKKPKRDWTNVIVAVITTVISTAGLVLVGMMANHVGPFNDKAQEPPTSNLVESIGNVDFDAPSNASGTANETEVPDAPTGETTPDGELEESAPAAIGEGLQEANSANRSSQPQAGQLLVMNECSSAIELYLYFLDKGRAHIEKWDYPAGATTIPTFNSGALQPNDGHVFYYARRADGAEWKGDVRIEHNGQVWPMRDTQVSRDDQGRYVLRFGGC